MSSLISPGLAPTCPSLWICDINTDDIICFKIKNNNFNRLSINYLKIKEAFHSVTSDKSLKIVSPLFIDKI